MNGNALKNSAKFLSDVLPRFMAARRAFLGFAGHNFSLHHLRCRFAVDSVREAMKLKPFSGLAHFLKTEALVSEKDGVAHIIINVQLNF